MPFINVKTSVKVDEAKKQSIEQRLTDSISIIPGKSASHLMCAVEDEVNLMFHGEKAATAFVEVKIFGKSTRNAYEQFTAEVCKILQQEIGVAPDWCYVKFEEVENWGYNGFMF